MKWAWKSIVSRKKNCISVVSKLVLDECIRGMRAMVLKFLTTSVF